MHACALFFCLLVQQDDAKALWDFKVGTQWTYIEDDGGTKKTNVMVVKEKKDGKILIESKTTDEGDKEPSKVETMYMGFDAKLAVVVWGELKDGKEVDAMHWWKPGAKEWESPLGPGGEMKVTVKVAGKEKIKLAGKEWDATKCTFEIAAPGMEGEAGKAEYWIADGVGMLKMTMKMGEQSFVLELKEFSPAK